MSVILRGCLNRVEAGKEDLSMVGLQVAGWVLLTIGYTDAGGQDSECKVQSVNLVEQE